MTTAQARIDCRQKRTILWLIVILLVLAWTGEAFNFGRPWQRRPYIESRFRPRRQRMQVPMNDFQLAPFAPLLQSKRSSAHVSLDSTCFKGFRLSATVLKASYQDGSHDRPLQFPRDITSNRIKQQQSSRSNPFATLLRLVIVLAFYVFHLLVLSQRQLVFPVQLFPNERGHFTGIGWDSVAGMISLGIYAVSSSWNNKRNEATALEARSEDSMQTSRLFPWNLPGENLRFRLTTTLTFVLLIQAYFLTGRMSIFWEDILYELSARDFAITVPLFRALTVLMGHLSWVMVGALVLRWLPRPPPFFQQRKDSALQQESSTSNAKGHSDIGGNEDDFSIDAGNANTVIPRPESPPTETKIVKKLFRTDISTLYSQTGVPPKKPLQMPDRKDENHSKEPKKPPTEPSESPTMVSGPKGLKRHEVDPYYWFTTGSKHWMWWTIGGYFVSSWFFNLADFANQYILPTTILQDAQESIVSQLVNPEHNDFLASAVGYIAPCITAPWWEEVLYRGFCLPALTQLLGYRTAVFWQGIVFSAHHMSLTGALPLAVLGWTWAAVYTKSRNLFTVMIIHMLWNSRVFLGSWLGL